MSDNGFFSPTGVSKFDGQSLVAGQNGNIEVYDVSNGAVLAKGATMARSLASRFGDEFFVEDFGVVNDPTGALASANTAAYQAALNAAAGVARLRHRAGLVVWITGVFVNNNDLDWIIDGTINKAPVSAGNVDNDVIHITASNVTIYMGSGSVIDGKGSTQLGTGLSSCINTPGGTTATGLPNPTTNQSNVNVVGHGTIQNALNFPIGITSVAGSIIDGITMTNNGNAGGFNWGANNCHISNCNISNCLDYGWAFYEGVYNGTMTNCVFTNVALIGCLNDGNSTDTNGYDTYPCHDIIIRDNFIINGVYGGIVSENNTGYASANFYNIDIVNNHCINCSTSQPAISIISLIATSNSKVEGNLISGGGLSGSNNFGINPASTCSYILIKNNIIQNLGQAGTGTGFGIAVGAPYSIFESNWIRDTQTTPTMQYGLYGTFGVGCICRNNVIQNMTVNANQTTLASDTIFENLGTYYLQTTGSETLIAPAGTGNVPLVLAGAGTSGVNFNSLIYSTKGVQITSGQALQIGNAYVSGAPTPTGYIEITDSAGVVRKVPCV